MSLKLPIKKRPVQKFEWDLFTNGITQSAISNLLSCPEKFRLSQVEGWSTEKSTYAIEFGNIFHEALDKVYSNFSQLNSLKDVTHFAGCTLSAMRETALSKSRMFRMLASDVEEEINNNYAIAECVLGHYFNKWLKEDKARHWVVLEQQFDNLYIHPIRKFKIPMRGKIDGVFKEGKQLWQLETKTKGQIDEQQMKDKLHFDLQNFFYLYNTMIMHGKLPAGVLYNVVRRPMLRIKKNEPYREFINRIDDDIASREDWYFMRWNISITEEDFKKWEVDFNRIMGHVERTFFGGNYYKNSNACTGRSGVCSFLPVCSRGDFYGLKVRDKLFPELD